MMGVFHLLGAVTHMLQLGFRLQRVDRYPDAEQGQYRDNAKHDPSQWATILTAVMFRIALERIAHDAHSEVPPTSG
jgi:hypothetical protein